MYFHNSCQREQFLTACSDSLLLQNLLHMIPRLMGHGRKYQESDNFNLEKQYVCNSANSHSLPPFKSRKLRWNWSSHISETEEYAKRDIRMKPAASRAECCLTLTALHSVMSRKIRLFYESCAGRTMQRQRSITNGLFCEQGVTTCHFNREGCVSRALKNA